MRFFTATLPALLLSALATSVAAAPVAHRTDINNFGDNFASNDNSQFANIDDEDFNDEHDLEKRTVFHFRQTGANLAHNTHLGINRLGAHMPQGVKNFHTKHIQPTIIKGQTWAASKPILQKANTKVIQPVRAWNRDQVNLRTGRLESKATAKQEKINAAATLKQQREAGLAPGRFRGALQKVPIIKSIPGIRQKAPVDNTGTTVNAGTQTVQD